MEGRDFNMGSASPLFCNPFTQVMAEASPSSGEMLLGRQTSLKLPRVPPPNSNNYGSSAQQRIAFPTHLTPQAPIY